MKIQISAPTEDPQTRELIVPIRAQIVEDITLRQLWWLKGSSIKSSRKEDNLARDFDRSYDMHVKDRIVSSLCKSFEYVCDTRAQCLTG